MAVIAVSGTPGTQRTGVPLGALALRCALTGGLALAAWLLGCAVAQAATDGNSTPNSTVSVQEPPSSDNAIADFHQLFSAVTSAFSHADDYSNVSNVTEHAAESSIAAFSASMPTTKQPSYAAGSVASAPNRTSPNGGSSSPSATDAILDDALTSTALPPSYGGHTAEIWSGSVSASVPVDAQLPTATAVLSQTAQQVRRAEPAAQAWSATRQIAPEQCAASGNQLSSTSEQKQQLPPADQTRFQQRLALLPSTSSSFGFSGQANSASGAVAGVVPAQLKLQPSIQFAFGEHKTFCVCEGSVARPGARPD